MENKARVSKYFTLSALLKIRKNNYVGVLNEGAHYSAIEIDNAIQEKLKNNLKNYCESCEVIHKQLDCPCCGLNSIDDKELEEQFYRMGL